MRPKLHQWESVKARMVILADSNFSLLLHPLSGYLNPSWVKQAGSFKNVLRSDEKYVGKVGKGNCGRRTRSNMISSTFSSPQNPDPGLRTLVALVSRTSSESEEIIFYTYSNNDERI